jgi:hypothetical protein
MEVKIKMIEINELAEDGWNLISVVPIDQFQVVVILKSTIE